MARRILTLALVVYLAIVAWGTLGPDPGNEVNAVGRQVKSAEQVVRGEEAPVTPRGTSPNFGRLTSEDLGNVMLFIPFGVLVPMRFARLKWWTVPLGSALSAGIELTQLVFLPHRTAEWRDWVWNSTGAIVGFAVFVVASSLWKNSRSTVAVE